MELFQNLHKESGQTVILVTHDLYVARHTDRIIKLSDGHIVSDEVNHHPIKAGTAASRRNSSVGVLEMLFSENFKIALRALRANKLRSILTMLGIVIGVATVVALLSIGKGATASITSQIQSNGSNLLTVSPGRQQRGMAGCRAISTNQLFVLLRL